MNGVREHRGLRRLGGTLLSMLIAAVGVIGLLVFFASRDSAPVQRSQHGPGRAFVDLGHRHISPGEARPPYDSDPPTSGPHVPRSIPADARALSDDQILEALERGNVVLAYGTAAPPAGIRGRLAPDLPPRYVPALAQVGQEIILDHRPGTNGITALAWAHMLRVPSADDPRLAAFVDYWLGRGAQGQPGSG